MDIILEVKQISSGHNIYEVSYDEHGLLPLIIIMLDLKLKQGPLVEIQNLQHFDAKLS